jgi:A predicted alpha-helical domain with a conserved ER motif.
LEPRPFLLRVFAARDARGQWSVMPGGFARIGEHLDVRAALIGEGAFSADVCIVSEKPVTPITLMSAAETVTIRRNPGTLPSRVADNLFWLGRYLERAEAVLGLVRAAIGGSIDVDGGAQLAAETITRLGNLLAASGAAAIRARTRDADIIALARAAMDDAKEMSSVRSILRNARAIGEGSRERLATDVWRLLDAPFPIRLRCARRSFTNDLPHWRVCPLKIWDGRRAGVSLISGDVLNARSPSAVFFVRSVMMRPVLMICPRCLNCPTAPLGIASAIRPALRPSPSAT